MKSLNSFIIKYMHPILKTPLVFIQKLLTQKKKHYIVDVPLVLDREGIRKLTPRECARLQVFPDTFISPSTLSDTVLYEQIGNSVSIPVIEKIAGEEDKQDEDITKISIIWPPFQIKDNNYPC